jgi:hypothetical protein
MRTVNPQPGPNVSKEDGTALIDLPMIALARLVFLRRLALNRAIPPD